MTVGVVCALLGIMMLLLAIYIRQPTLLYLYAVFFGLGAGLNSPTLVAIAADIFPGRHFGAIYGLIGTAVGIGGALSPWLGGRIYDATGSYTWAFAISGTGTFLACPLIWLAAPRKVRLVAGKLRKGPAVEQPLSRRHT